MKTRFAGLLAAMLVLPAVAQAQGRIDRGAAHATAPVAADGRAPWNAPWAYDSGGDNDRHPELPYYQQGRGQQTGGPARNLLPDDGLHIVPR
ncbi:hypothetical protein [uncultured Methylobacterium sp.]|uniref:hypothetical protein n=1 Tax=uncultured Methylobacterium sp. TaxID=157278 RepID=UPI0035CA8345